MMIDFYMTLHLRRHLLVEWIQKMIQEILEMEIFLKTVINLKVSKLM